MNLRLRLPEAVSVGEWHAALDILQSKPNILLRHRVVIDKNSEFDQFQRKILSRPCQDLPLRDNSLQE